MSTRVPPAHAELEFVHNNKTGRVHIQRYVPEKGERGHVEPQRVPFAEGLVEMFLARQSMLCGARIRVGFDETFPGMPATMFPDDDLCIACVHALGGQQARAFEGHYPEDEA